MFGQPFTLTNCIEVILIMGFWSSRLRLRTPMTGGLSKGSLIRSRRTKRKTKGVLFLAPQPFYQDRGTPIAVDLLLRVYCERAEKVDVIAYHEGKSLTYDGINITRTPNLPFICNIRPGFSFKKLICDIFMLFQALYFVATRQYKFVHAVEESVFIALIIKFLTGIPYIYDMDSSLSQQMTEKYPSLSALFKPLEFLEGIAINQAEVVVPVCERLAKDVERHRPKKVVILPDVSLVG